MSEHLIALPQAAAGVKSWRRTFGNLWQRRKGYVYLRDWLLSIYHRVLLRFPNLPLPGRHGTARVRLKGLSEPVYVRLGTTDWYVLEEIFLDEVYAPAIKDAQEVRRIVDLGANTGFSIRLWQANFPSASIVAVEPDEDNLQMCRKNILRYETGDSRTQLVQACVAATPRRVTLDRSMGSWGYTMRDARTQGDEQVEALTLPQIMAECGMEGTIDLLKCNIEGAEQEVFAHCKDWIGRVRRLAVQVHLPYTAEKFLEDLRSSGARLTLYHSMDYADGSKLLFMEQDSSQPPLPPPR